MNETSDGRLRLVLGLAALCFAALIVRTGYLSLVRHAALRSLAQEQQTQVVAIPPPRGPILDRTGHALANSMENHSLVWEGASCPQLVDAARELATVGFCSATRPAELAARDWSVESGSCWRALVVARAPA